MSTSRGKTNNAGRSRVTGPRLRGLSIACLVVAALATTSCGGATGGGQGPDGAGQGLVLLSFLQSSQDNVSLNTRLEFRFSEALDPSTITNASIQLRQGPDFGLTVPGLFVTDGSSVIFEPRLPGLCDYSDSGLKPGLDYRVVLVGFPEEFAVKNTKGQSLAETQTYNFRTREDSDPEKFLDQIPGFAPEVTVMTPGNASQAVTVVDGNDIVLTFSENLEPCSVNDGSVLFYMYQRGDPTYTNSKPAPNGKPSGFYAGNDTSDQNPADPYDWGGSAITLAQPQKILATINLEQDFHGTQIRVSPTFGRFPENALIVVECTFGITDFGGLPLTPFVASFTTENKDGQSGTYLVENANNQPPYLEDQSTADIDTARAPSRVQGYLLFAGDGDNGATLNDPSFPVNLGGPCDFALNSGAKTDFIVATMDELLDTGSSASACDNSTDGSRAVVWEFNTFRIGSGFKVRVIGVNPAIVLVQGDVVIEGGGALLLRGDGASGYPDGDGRKGGSYQGSPTGLTDIPGGVGVAGGGDGGIAWRASYGHPRHGQDGFSGFGAADWDWTMNPAGAGLGGEGAGLGGQSMGTATSAAYNPWDGSSAGGGGGGHSDVGVDGQANDGQTVYKLKGALRGFGGSDYEPNPNSGDRLQTPEAGSGGGAGGHFNAQPFNTSTAYVANGGSGGAGGGFIDLTSSGDIAILGTLDAAGGAGGDGGGWNSGATVYNAAGGGGGGSGGGIRLLTPNDIIFGSQTIVTAAGGSGGVGFTPAPGQAYRNDGGAGSDGRIVLEDGDSVITGFIGAAVTPGEGATGFYRGVFDAARFQGGGLMPQALSDLFAVGPLDPTFTPPLPADFIAAVPPVSSRGVNNTSILIEARGYQMMADGTADTGTPSDWHTIGYFTDSSIEHLPSWNTGQPLDGVQIPADNMGGSIANLNGYEFLQLRITFYLPSSMGPFDPGPYLDDWTIRFTHDR